ncbi:glycosyltransferase [Azoarcus sp. CIB]|uniref:glycosyltransferase n=1 Tax=Aromatoleum sp. (strain CIB) TaxID=198107 RepID=UPI00067C6350|nr:glycosyltransferase [Azoarcus sp. CIB]
MNMPLQHAPLRVVALVATKNRHDLLAARALPSIASQWRPCDELILVDDAAEAASLGRCQNLAESLGLPVSALHNRRTPGAAGAWNTGLDHLARHTADPRRVFIAFLDDDDQWLPHHLEQCIGALQAGASLVASGFVRVVAGQPDEAIKPPARVSLPAFYVGNPGLQPSNLVVRLDRLLEAGGFDESLPSCTDRDLLIRILRISTAGYRRVTEHTVRHHACGDRSRLCTPGSPQRQAGLTAFFDKHGPHMRAAQLQGARDRAKRLFDWQVPVASAEAAQQPDGMCLASSPSVDHGIHLVVGLITDALRIQALDGLMQDLVLLQLEPGLVALDVLVLDNSTDADSDELPRAADRWRAQGLRIQTIGQSARAAASLAGELPTEAQGRLAIGPARTCLQSYLYRFCKSRPGAVAWILDDDMRLDPLLAFGAKLRRTRYPLVPWLAKLRDEGVDIAIGSYTGAAPLPTLSTLRVQLVDLVATLRWLARLDPDEALPDMSLKNAALRLGKRDYYYCLSHHETDRLETPFWLLPEYPGETVGAAFERLCSNLHRLLSGEQLFRPLAIDAAALANFDLKDALHRGGNTWIFDIEALRDAPNAVPEIRGRVTRRSDMIWALIQRDRYRRKVVSVPLGVYHAREAQVIDTARDECTLIDDIRGFAVFSALQDKSVDPGLNLAERAEKYREERLAAFRLSIYRIRGLGHELAALARSKGWIGASADRVLAFADTVLRWVDSDLLNRVTKAVSQLSGLDVVVFEAGLSVMVTEHQDRLRSSTLIDAQLHEQRLLNAESVARRLVGRHLRTDAALQCLGQGSEGVVFTDGQRVLKVIDYWKPRQAARARDRIASLVGRWPTGKGLYGIKQFLIEGIHSVLIYPYEPSQPYLGGQGPGLVDLMAECHAKGLVCRNIHPKNLRSVGCMVRLIDYGGDLLLTNEVQDFEAEFTAMCRRAYLAWRHSNRTDLNELLRASSTDAYLPELSGFEEYFMRAVRETTEQQPAVDPLLANVSRLPLQRVLDFGCGKGEVSGLLASLGHSVVAYDPDLALVERLESLRSQNLIPAHCLDQVLAHEPFDLVICRRVICLLDDAAMNEVVAQLRRCVSRQGRLLLAICHPAYAPRIATSEALPEAPAAIDPETSFRWTKRHRRSGRTLIEFHRPERVILKLLRRAGFELVQRLERETIDQIRFEPACDLLIYEFRPVEPLDCTLLIKACAMETDMLATRVRHLVEQLESPRAFYEVILVLDSRKNDFLRQYTDGSLVGLRAQAAVLQAQGWVDRVVIAPVDAKTCSELAAKWIGYAHPGTHADNGAPLAAILAGFEACQTPYLLQTDLDVIVARRDPKHDYLSDMVRAVDSDPMAVTVAFNIAHVTDLPYTGAGPAGPWRVEVRIAMLQMQRLRALLPLVPSCPDNSSVPAWHRALDRVVKRGLAHSLRGGNHRTFFVHPTNERKSDLVDLARIASRVATGSVPSFQLDAVDLQGTVEQWLQPTRFERFVFIIAGRNVEPGRFRRCLESVQRQACSDWGAVVIDDASCPAWGEVQRRLCSGIGDRVSFVCNPVRRGLLANTVDAIRIHCGHPDSVIITLDADDCLVGTNVLDILAAEYDRGADMTVGSMCRTDKRADYPACLRDPRANRGGNVWQHLRSFKKSLFDQIPDEHLRLDGAYVELASDWALMLPMVELAHSPRWIRQCLYLHEPGGARDAESRSQRDAVIASLMTRPSLRNSTRDAASAGSLA